MEDKAIRQGLETNTLIPSNYPKASFAKFGSYTNFEVRTDNFSLGWSS